MGIFLGIEKRFVAHANLFELCGPAYVCVSVQATMSHFERYAKGMPRGVREEFPGCLSRKYIQM